MPPAPASTSPTTAPKVAPVEVIEERPDPTLSDGDGDHERMAHIIRKDDQMKGYVMGEQVTALCGKKWVPARDPERYPVCQTCLEMLGQIRAAGAN